MTTEAVTAWIVAHPWLSVWVLPVVFGAINEAVSRSQNVKAATIWQAVVHVVAASPVGKIPGISQALSAMSTPKWQQPKKRGNQ